MSDSKDNIGEFSSYIAQPNFKPESYQSYKQIFDLPNKSYVLAKKSIISNEVKIEVIEKKNNETVFCSSPLNVAAYLNISVKRLAAIIKSKSNKPLKGTYIIKVSADSKNIFNRNYVMVFNEDKTLTFTSINSARLYFNVKWSLIKNNIDKDHFVNINGVYWKIVSFTPQN